MPTSEAPPLGQRLNLKLFRVALILAAAFFTFSLCRPLMDNVDLGWHVAQGRWMAGHAAIYARDVMNYPNSGQSLINEYPLFQIVLYSVWTLGWWGLFFFTWAMYGALAFALMRAAWTFLAPGSALFALTFVLMLVYFQLAFPLRPHLVTYVAIGIFGVFLLHHRNPESWTEFWPMAVLQVAWTNCHSAFVLGPIMAGMFGLEMTVRKSVQQRRIAWATARLWIFVFALMLIACLVNPFGWMRFYPPFYQGGLEEIKAYVGEMQPLTGLASSLIVAMTLLGAAAVALSMIQARGAISFSFLFLAILLYVESLSVLKSWPVFGLFPPLLVLSSGAFGPSRPRGEGIAWCSAGGNLLVAILLVFGLFVRAEGNASIGIPAIWREYDLGRRELPYLAVDWMRARDIQGRLLHRCEDGGLLQERGYDRGETFSDTGFGKYDEAMIRIVAMVGERPALLPLYFQAYHPEFVICNSLCFRWPFYLRQLGWRMIFYSASATVWTLPETRPDLPTITGDTMEASFLRDIALHGRPEDPLLYGRNLLAMNSNGRENLVFSQLASLPNELHHAAWYWEAARILCFETPSFSPKHREQLLAEAESLHEDSLTAEFRAFAHAKDGDTEGARKILEAAAPGARGSHANDLLLEIAIEEHRPEALSLAESSAGVDLRDGRHWEFVARAEEDAGRQKAAGEAWGKAVFFYPDDVEIVAGAKAFAGKFRDDELAHAIDQSVDLTAH